MVNILIYKYSEQSSLLDGDDSMTKNDSVGCKNLEKMPIPRLQRRKLSKKLVNVDIGS